MKVHVFYGIGLSAPYMPFITKNVRVIGNLDAVADEIHSRVGPLLVTKPFVHEVVDPFPYEAGLGYFVRLKLDNERQGFYFCLTGEYKANHLKSIRIACSDLSCEIGDLGRPGEKAYIAGVKKALELT